MMEDYLVIDPDGSLRWIHADAADLLTPFHEAIGCKCLENVYTVLPDIVLIIDECGKIKQIPQQFNPVASRLYAGWLCVREPIVGPAVVAAIHLRDGESDWVPLNAVELAKLSVYLGIEIPDK